MPMAGPSPTREKPEDVSCICSLDDVNSFDLAIEDMRGRDLAIGRRNLSGQARRSARDCAP